MFGRKDKRPVLVILLISILLISSISLLPGNSISQSSSDHGLLIEIDDPTEGDVWTGSTEHNISWTLNTSLDPGNIDLTIEYVYNGTGPYLIEEYEKGDLSNLTSNHTWQVPALDHEDVKLMIRAEGEGYKAWDMVSFEVDSTSPKFISTVPEEDKVLLSGSSIEVSFSEKVDHDDFENNFSLYKADNPIEGSVTGGKKNDNYTVKFTPNQPLDPGDDYYFEINGTIKDTSEPGNLLNMDLTINFIVERGPPNVQVTTSIGSEIRIGNTTQIDWMVDQDELASKPINISYSMDGGDSWISIANQISNKGSISWEVPEEPMGEYPVDHALINVSCENTYGYTGYGFSNSFTIYKNKKPQVKLQRPYEGLKLIKGQETDIKWNASDEIPLPEKPITISISTDGGVSWRAISHNAKNDGVYSWKIDTAAEEAVINLSCTDKDGAKSWVHSPVFTILEDNPLNLTLNPSKETYHPRENINVSWEVPVMVKGYQFMRVNLTTSEENVRRTKEVGAGNTSTIISTPFAMSSHCKIKIEVIDDTGTLYHMESQKFEIFPSLKDTNIVEVGEMTMIRLEFDSYVSRGLMERSLTLYKDGEKMDISTNDIYAQSGSNIAYITKDLQKGKYRLELNSSRVNRDFKDKTIFTFEREKTDSESEGVLEYWPILLLIPIIAFLLYHYRKRLKPKEKTSIDKVDIEKHQKYKE